MDIYDLVDKAELIRSRHVPPFGFVYRYWYNTDYRIGSSIEVFKDNFTFGSGKECDVKLVCRGASRVHCRLEIASKSGVIAITDVSECQSGIWVNGSWKRQALLCHGDIFCILVRKYSFDYAEHSMHHPRHKYYTSPFAANLFGRFDELGHSRIIIRPLDCGKKDKIANKSRISKKHDDFGPYLMPERFYKEFLVRKPVLKGAQPQTSHSKNELSQQPETSIPEQLKGILKHRPDDERKGPGTSYMSRNISQSTKKLVDDLNLKTEEPTSKQSALISGAELFKHISEVPLDVRRFSFSTSKASSVIERRLKRKMKHIASAVCEHETEFSLEKEAEGCAFRTDIPSLPPDVPTVYPKSNQYVDLLGEVEISRQCNDTRETFDEHPYLHLLSTRKKRRSVINFHGKYEEEEPLFGREMKSRNIERTRGFRSLITKNVTRTKFEKGYNDPNTTLGDLIPYVGQFNRPLSRHTGAQIVSDWPLNDEIKKIMSSLIEDEPLIEDFDWDNICGPPIETMNSDPDVPIVCSYCESSKDIDLLCLQVHEYIGDSVEHFPFLSLLSPDQEPLGLNYLELRSLYVKHKRMLCSFIAKHVTRARFEKVSNDPNITLLGLMTRKKAFFEFTFKHPDVSIYFLKPLNDKVKEYVSAIIKLSESSPTIETTKSIPDMEEFPFVTLLSSDEKYPKLDKQYPELDKHELRNLHIEHDRMLCSFVAKNVTKAQFEEISKVSNMSLLFLMPRLIDIFKFTNKHPALVVYFIKPLNDRVKKYISAMIAEDESIYFYGDLGASSSFQTVDPESSQYIDPSEKVRVSDAIINREVREILEEVAELAAGSYDAKEIVVDVAEVATDIFEVQEVSAEVEKVITDTFEVQEILAEVAEVTADTSEVREILAEAAEVAEVFADTYGVRGILAEVAEDIYEVQDILAEVHPDTYEVQDILAEVHSNTYKVQDILAHVAEVSAGSYEVGDSLAEVAACACEVWDNLAEVAVDTHGVLDEDIISLIETAVETKDPKKSYDEFSLLYLLAVTWEDYDIEDVHQLRSRNMQKRYIKQNRDLCSLIAKTVTKTRWEEFSNYPSIDLWDLIPDFGWYDYIVAYPNVLLDLKRPLNDKVKEIISALIENEPKFAYEDLNVSLSSTEPSEEDQFTETYEEGEVVNREVTQILAELAERAEDTYEVQEILVDVAEVATDAFEVQEIVEVAADTYEVHDILVDIAEVATDTFEVQAILEEAVDTHEVVDTDIISQIESIQRFEFHRDLVELLFLNLLSVKTVKTVKSDIETHHELRVIKRIYDDELFDTHAEQTTALCLLIIEKISIDRFKELCSDPSITLWDLIPDIKDFSEDIFRHPNVQIDYNRPLNNKIKKVISAIIGYKPTLYKGIFKKFINNLAEAVVDIYDVLGADVISRVKTPVKVKDPKKSYDEFSLLYLLAVMWEDYELDDVHKLCDDEMQSLYIEQNRALCSLIAKTVTEARWEELSNDPSIDLWDLIPNFGWYEFIVTYPDVLLDLKRPLNDKVKGIISALIENESKDSDEDLDVSSEDLSEEVQISGHGKDAQETSIEPPFLPLLSTDEKLHKFDVVEISNQEKTDTVYRKHQVLHSEVDEELLNAPYFSPSRVMDIIRDIYEHLAECADYDIHEIVSGHVACISIIDDMSEISDRVPSILSTVTEDCFIYDAASRIYSIVESIDDKFDMDDVSNVVSSIVESISESNDSTVSVTQVESI